MNTDIKHFGRIDSKGNIFFNNEELWEEQRLSLVGKDFELIVKERVRKPTVSQFSYYWGGILKSCLKCEAFSHFYTVEEVHKEVFAPLFLSYKTKVNMGEKSWENNHVRSISGLSKKEMGEFVDKVLNWCNENGIEILPAEQYSNKFYTEEDK